MKKVKLTLSVDDELLARAKQEELNISAFLEIRLADCFGLKRVSSSWIKLQSSKIIDERR